MHHFIHAVHDVESSNKGVKHVSVTPLLKKSGLNLTVFVQILTQLSTKVTTPKYTGKDILRIQKDGIKLVSCK